MALPVLLTTVVAAFLVVLLLPVLLLMLRVREHEVAVLYRAGVRVALLGPGLHVRPRFLYEARVVDLRRTIATVPGQELLTADNVGLKLSVALVYEVEDAVRMLHAVEDARAALYLSVQLALRNIVAGVEAEALLSKRLDIGEALRGAAEPDARAAGLKLHRVEVKDVMLPGEWKAVMAEVVRARKEGQAALERARGETAALRSLANAARMLQENPRLYDLRLLQAMGQWTGTGNSIVMGLPAGTPVAVTKT